MTNLRGRGKSPWYLCFFSLHIITFSPDVTVTVSAKEVCPPKCMNGDNCSHISCQNCQFKCSGKCDINANNYGKACDSKCDPNSCSKSWCKGCLFCYSGGIKSSKQCNLPKYVDITSAAYSNAQSYQKWFHSKLPYPYYGPPIFTDIDGDGILDYFNPMHAHGVKIDGYKGRMELARGSLSINGNYKMEPLLNHVYITEKGKLNSIDTHGSNLVDLDNDGVLDLYITSGGGEGAGKVNKNHFSRYNFLFWGRKVYDESTGEYYTVFEGGRDVAQKAGLHMRKGRGRLSLVFDANGDGLLDVFSFQERPITNDVSPGVLLINKNNRTWREEKSMSEYTRAALLTDADGDGIAQELIVSRSFCWPQREGPATDPSYKGLGPFTKQQKKFCGTRPVGSIAVYKYKKKTDSMDQIANKYRRISSFQTAQPPCCAHASFSGSKDCHAISIASGDFDGDLKADHVFLYQSKMTFYFSTDRFRGSVPSDTHDIGLEIYFPNYCTDAQGFHVVDLDNDGTEEILVVCKTVATLLVYSKGDSKKDWSLNNGCNSKGSLGDLVDPTFPTPSKSFMRNFCGPGNKDGTKKKICKNFTRLGHSDSQQVGLCLVDLNNDGYLDAVTTHDFGRLQIFKSKPVKSHKFIAFQLQGDGKTVNRYAIGSTVILYSRSSKDNKVHKQFREISSYQTTADKVGCKDDRIIFGLNYDLEPLKVFIRWPNGKKQTFWLNNWWKFDKYLKPFIITYGNTNINRETMEASQSSLLPNITPRDDIQIPVSGFKPDSTYHTNATVALLSGPNES